MAKRVGPYEIAGQIGRGGMAVVYLARQPALGRQVALKELAPFGTPDETLARRFLREAQLASSLNHPNIVTVFDFIEQDGVSYIAMEYLERGSLRPFVGGMSLPQVAGVLEGLLAGLSHAEVVKVIHRDIKPENLLVTADGGVKIADFGISKAYQQVATEEMLTPAGATVGTPAYMAPEQAMALEIGPWTDLYQTGVVAYELLAGQVPFDADGSPIAVMMQHINEPVPPLPADIDPALAAWVLRMVAKEPADRPAGAREAFDELEEIVLAAAGPLWRRDARLTDPDPETEPAKPLTPAHFSSWHEYVPGEKTTPPADSSWWTAPQTPAPGSSWAGPPPVTPPPVEAIPPPPVETPPPVQAAPPVTPPPEPAATLPSADTPPPPSEPPATQLSTTPRRRRAPLLLGGLGLVVIAIIAAVVFGGGGGDPTPTPTATATPTPTVTPTATTGAAAGPFAVGARPDGVAVGAGAVWAVSSRQGTLTRIDPQTGDTTKVAVGDNPDSVLVALDRVWVTVSGEDKVVELSTDERPRVVGSIAVGQGPEGIAASGKAIWVANAGDGSVTQYIPASRATNTMDVGGRPVDVAIGGNAVWAADSANDTVVKIDGAHHAVVGSVGGIGGNPRAVAAVGEDVWVISADDGIVSRVESDTDAVADRVDVGGQPRDITTDGDSLWVTDRRRGRVVQIDAASARVVDQDSVDGGPLGVAVGFGAVWVTGFDSGDVTRL
jgi:serine/threonine protein kinase